MQFISGKMPLRIEAVRWQGKPLEERLCLVCSRGIVEDEFHFFVCECQTYNLLREDLFKSINDCYPEFEVVELREEFIYIIKHDSRRLARLLVRHAIVEEISYIRIRIYVSFLVLLHTAYRLVLYLLLKFLFICYCKFNVTMYKGT